MKQIFELLIDNPFGIMFIITGLSFLGIFLAVFWGWKYFRKALDKINKWTIAVLIALFLLYLLFLIPGFKNGFIPSDEEWFGIKQAREIVDGDLQVFNHSWKGIGYSFIVAGFMTVFGITEHAAIIANVFFSALTIILVGLTAYVASRSNVAAVSGAIGYASLPLVVKFAGFSMGYPAMGVFFMALFAFFGSVAVKEKSFASHVAMWLVAALASGIKPEFIVLVFPAIVAGIMTIASTPRIKKKIKDNYPKLILFAIAITISFIPFLVKYYQADRNFKDVNGTIGIYPSQKGDRPVSAIDKILRPFLNSRISFDYLAGDADNFLLFIVNLQKGTFIAVIIIGILLYAIKRRNKKDATAKIFMFLIITACCVAAIYMAADVIFDEEGGRFAFYILPFVSIMFGSGLAAIFDYLQDKAPLYLAVIPLLILPAYIVNVVFFTVPEASRSYNHDLVLVLNQGRIVVASNKIDKTKTTIYTKNGNLTNFFRFNGYNSYSFTDMVNTGTPTDPEAAIKTMEVDGWENDREKIILITSADKEESNYANAIVPIVEAFVKDHDPEEIPLGLINSKVYRLR